MKKKCCDLKEKKQKTTNTSKSLHFLQHICIFTDWATKLGDDPRVKDFDISTTANFGNFNCHVFLNMFLSQGGGEQFLEDELVKDHPFQICC